jgi:hypothetical protein
MGLGFLPKRSLQVACHRKCTNPLFGITWRSLFWQNGSVDSSDQFRKTYILEGCFSSMEQWVLKITEVLRNGAHLLRIFSFFVVLGVLGFDLGPCDC